MSIKNKNLKLESDIQQLSTIVNNYEFGTKMNNIQKAYNQILDDYNNFIVMGTLDKINIAFKTDATGKTGKYNDQDEKHNQQIINDIKKQVKIINENIKGIDYGSKINAKIQSDNVLERFMEIGLGDGYYIKQQIGNIIDNQLNPCLTYLNGVIKNLIAYSTTLQDSIAKNITNAKEELDEASKKTNGTKIVVGGKDKMESYKKRLMETSSLLINLKKECMNFSKKLEQLKAFTIKYV